MPLYQLGEEITFETKTLVPQSMGRNLDWRWAVQERILRHPARQAIGPGDDVITFSGVIFPTFQIGGNYVGIKQLKKFEKAGNQMEPMMLNDGTGHVYGLYCLESVEEEREVFFDNGAPRKQTFTIKLGKYFEDQQGIGSGVETTGMTSSNVA